MKKMRNRSKIQKAEYKRKIPGDHKLRFYRDSKSGHPYMSISKNGNKYYGHEMTSHPSVREGGKPRKKYVKMHKNPNPDDKRISYYNRNVKRIINIDFRLRLHPKWKIGSRDLRILKIIDKKKIKNVRRDNN